MDTIPGTQVTAAISSCEAAEQGIANAAGLDGSLSGLATEAHAITEELRSAADSLDIGCTALGQYTADLGIPTHAPDFEQAAPPRALPPVHVASPRSQPAEAAHPQTFEPDEHKQKEPESWSDLVVLSADLLAEDTDPMYAARALRAAYENLTDQEIEDVRYFALGELCARLAPYLRNLAQREDVIQKTVAAMVDVHSHYVNTNSCTADAGLYVHEIHAAHMRAGAATLVAEVFSQLPAPVRQLADTISQYALERRVQRQYEYKGMLEPYLPNGILGSGEAVKSMTLNMFSAVAGITRDAILLSVPPEMIAGGGELAEYKVLLGDVMDPEALRSLNIWQPAHAGARLHFDEVGYHEYFKKHMSKDADGRVYVNMRDLPKIPERVPLHTPSYAGTRALHSDRIGCPAKFVLPLIPSVLEMTPEIIIRADKQIPVIYKNYRRSKYRS